MDREWAKVGKAELGCMWYAQTGKPRSKIRIVSKEEFLIK
jgi:hypothetical protein